MLGLAVVNLSTKFEISIFTGYEDNVIKATQSVENWVVWVITGNSTMP